MYNKTKRQHKRYKVNGKKLRGRLFSSCKASIQNISSGGACISVDKQLNIDKEFVFKLECKDDFIPVRATVSWSKTCNITKKRSGDLKPEYLMGLEFKDTLENKGIEVIDFINQDCPDFGDRTNPVQLPLLH
jgi:hypothetical protein